MCTIAVNNFAIFLFLFFVSSKHATCATSHRQDMQNYKCANVGYNKMMHTRQSKLDPQ